MGLFYRVIIWHLFCVTIWIDNNSGGMSVMDPDQSTWGNHSSSLLNDYHSVEVALEKVQLSYQFKLRRSKHNSLFFIIKDNSKILLQLKAGNILPLKYYGSNALEHCEVKPTQIDRITDEKQGRFEGHHRVDLTIIANKAEILARQHQTAT